MAPILWAVHRVPHDQGPDGLRLVDAYYSLVPQSDPPLQFRCGQLSAC